MKMYMHTIRNVESKQETHIRVFSSFDLDLDLDPIDLGIWTWPEDSKDVPELKKMNFLRHSFQKLEHYRQTDRQMSLNTLP